VKYRLIAAFAIASALSLSVATAVPAGAAPQRTPQVNGDLLLYALVPDSAFGSSFSSDGSHATGSKLLSTRARYHVPSMGCASFEAYFRVGEYGDTAGAWDEFLNPDYLHEWPTVLGGVQIVNQFASDSAATTFYQQELAKYQACQTFTEPDPTDPKPGGGTFEIAATQVTKTPVGGNQGFQVSQEMTISNEATVTFFINNLIVVSGADVYQFWDVNGTDDEPWPDLMSQLIRSVQRLR
jgi:hypothetical protein